MGDGGELERALDDVFEIWSGAGENTLRRLALFVYPDHPTKNDVTSG